MQLTQQVQALATEMAALRADRATFTNVPWGGAMVQSPAQQAAYSTQHGPPETQTYTPLQPVQRQQGRGNYRGGRQEGRGDRRWRQRMAQNANPPTQQNQ